MIDNMPWSGQIQIFGFLFPFLGILLCGLSSSTLGAGDVHRLLLTNTGSSDGVVYRVPVRNAVNVRRDPFKPIIKRRGIFSSSRKKRPVPATIPPVPKVKNPNWKLLGIIHGQYGRQAVIQVAPHKRVFGRAGLEVFQSGWIIKTISKDEVLLENFAASPLGESVSKPKVFILSFPDLSKTS